LGRSYARNVPDRVDVFAGRQVFLSRMRPRFLAAAAMAIAAAITSPGSAAAAPAEDLTEGHRLFQLHCAGCHGPGGEGGRGPAIAVPTLSRAPDRQALIKVIRQGVEGTEMPAARLEEHEVERLAAFVRRLGKRRPEPLPGDPERGERLYAGKGACATCHTLHGRGGALGADLTEIGLRRGAAYLRASLVTPEADVPRAFSPYRADVSIAQNFLQVRVVPAATGREITGVRVNEDTFTIQLRDATNQVYSFFKSELRELHKDWGRSPMPSYAEVFSASELDDLVSFLMSRRGGAPSPVRGLGTP
jgi:cytochrome c oxidase cbb3-type subunit 3